MGNCKSVDVKQMGSGSTKVTKHKITLAIVGLDNAGKTVTTKVLQGANHNDVTPTIGFTSASFTFDKHEITLYDLGGGANIRGIWHQYYAEAYGFVFVIDASDTARLGECEQVLQKFLENKHVRGKPVLLLANKQDVPGALDESGICDQLSLEELANQFKSPCRVETCCAINTPNKKLDPSIDVGLCWLIKLIEVNWDELDTRVRKDVADKAVAEKQEKLERAKRVQQSRELREQEERSRGTLQDEDDEHDEPDGANPFQPIEQQLVAAQKREAINKRNKSSSKHRQDSGLETDLKDKHDSDEEPVTMDYGHSHRSVFASNRNSTPDKQSGRKSEITEHHPVEQHPYRPINRRDVDAASDHQLLHDNRFEGNRPLDSHGGENSHMKDRWHVVPVPAVALLSIMSDEEYCDDENKTAGYRRLTSNRNEQKYDSVLDKPNGPTYSLAANGSVSGTNGLLPNGLLAPIENVSPRERRKKKRKFKLRNHRTAPSPDSSDGSPFPSSTNLKEDTPRKQVAPLKTKRSPRLERLEENDDVGEDDNEAHSFTHKWTLVDDLPETLTKPVGQSSGHRGFHGSRPNTEYEDDLVT